MDTQLNQAGREQAATTGAVLKDVNFIAAYSSDSSRAADYMGSLSGTKAPARRPLPLNVETSHSISKRLTKFWDNTLIPLFVATTTTPTATTEGSPELVNTDVLAEPAILLVSHGATISKLIRDTLLVEHGYTATCDIARHGIYNTSISILRLSVSQEGEEEDLHENTGDDVATPTEPTSISGEFFKFASISHLLRRKDIVKENADILEQQGLFFLF
ncbi:hypothetical protein FRC12_000774 [Ceratobasidium sp. 428]|nr:hypothetical protein FRC12_000774 [Ceratobasidium sp. 428]